MDRIDCGIVEHLQRDARISNKDLAGELGISPSTCLERVRRLQSSGVLKGFHAEVDPDAIGIGVQAFVGLRIERHAKATFETIRTMMLSHKEVIVAYAVAGSQDHLLHVAVRDVEHLKTFLWESIMSHPDIAHVETSLILESERGDGLPLYGNAKVTSME